jgi:carbon monoxide dehydrogenase subunit G
MELENKFEVRADPSRVWELLLDVPRVVPCMPGAELVDTVSDDEWKARVKVKLGPIGLVFDAKVQREEVDEASRRVKLAVRAREMKGRGAAQAAIESSVAPTDGGSSVVILTDVSLSGPVAQYGRGVVKDVSAQLTDDFASCLRATLDADTSAPAAAEAPADAGNQVSDGSGVAGPEAPAHGTPATRPVGGFRLLLRALLARLRIIFKRG